MSPNRPRLTVVEPRDGDPPAGDPSRRVLLIAFVFVVLLAGLGYVVVEKMMDVATLQDCAATGRHDC